MKLSAGTIRTRASFEAVLIRNGKVLERRVSRPSLFRRILNWLRFNDLGLVTTAGMVYAAAELAGGTGYINLFKYHDCGTGTTAATIGDTGLQTPAGTGRVSGTGTTPGSTNVYQSVATIAFTSTLAITEWGLFSASASGTMLDHRIFSAINVNNGDSIQFTYALTLTAGGS